MKRFRVLASTALCVSACFLQAACDTPDEADEADGRAVQDVMPREVLMTDFSELEGRTWVLVDLCGEKIPEDARQVTLEFMEDGHVAGAAPVNRYHGEFIMTDEGLEVGPLASTMMAGEPEAMDRERAYLAAIGTATSLGLAEGDVLVIAVENQELPLRFEAVEEP